MNKIVPGTVMTLEVIREAPFGFFLTNGNEDILLHTNEMTEEVFVGKTIDVFIFQDKLGRKAATMKIPHIQIGKYGWGEVVDEKQDLGVFVGIGIGKDLFIHKDDLPKIKSVWPKKGDLLYCTMKLDRYGRILGKLATEENMQHLFTKASPQEHNKNIIGTVYRAAKVGTFVITIEGYRGFIHESERIEEPRLGQKIQGRIIAVKEDGSVNISLIPRKHEKLDEDAEKIFSYLQKRGGSMPYSDKSAPEDIYQRFQMTKAAFKRALGKLMKNNKIYQKDGWTYEIKD